MMDKANHNLRVPNRPEVLMERQEETAPDTMGEKKLALIVESQRLFRDALKFRLACETEFEVIGEARDGEEAIRLLKGTKPDLVMLALSMPRIDGFSVLRFTKKTNPSIKILVLTVHDSKEYVMNAFRLGADGYCLKDSSWEEMLLGMRSVLNGEMYISPGIAKKVNIGYIGGSRHIREKSAIEALSNRQREILKLIAEGHKNKDISQLLNIKIKTVESHRAKLISKLDLHNIAALTAFAYEHGLIISKS